MIKPGQVAPWRQVAVVLLLSAAGMLALEYFTNIDIWLEDWFFDAAQHNFPWRNHWFATDFAHGSLKNVIIQSGTLLLLVMLFDQVWRIRKMDHFWRYRLQIVAWSSVLVPAVIRGIKRLSVLNCPWDIDRYGGHVPYLKLFDHVPADWVPGHCFPAGHASTGLWLAALCVFWLPQSPRKALAVFAAGLSVGLALGWIQQMRGAHFLSHTLWSGWIASVIVVLLVAIYQRRLLTYPAMPTSGGKKRCRIRVIGEVDQS